MSVVCPTVLAKDEADYKLQMDRVSPFAARIQIDLADGDFAPTETVPLDKVWWPPALQADLHLMYRRPDDYLETIIRLKPQLVIVHAEADVTLSNFAEALHGAGIKAGLAVLPDTSVESVADVLKSFDHLLIFSGDLGHFGGKADFSLLEKAKQAKNIHPPIEVGWDGGINDENVKQLVVSGVDVLNTGGFIQKASEPGVAYAKLTSLIEDE